MSLIIAIILAAFILSSALGLEWSDLKTDEAYRQESLRIHNVLRKRHKSSELKLKISLCKLAEDWANAIAEEADKASDLTMALIRPEKDTDLLDGDNIGGLHVDTPNLKYIENDGGYPVRQWYYEIFLHNFDENRFHESTSHFTQLIWAKTKYLGVAKVKSAKGHLIFVCTYDPAGNYDFDEEFEKNVKAPDKPASGYWDEWMFNNPDFVKFIDNNGNPFLP